MLSCYAVAVRKRIMRAMPDAEPVELAVFELLPDGRVLATYHDETLRASLETDGIWSLATGWVTPADGKLFFDALDKEYRQSSFMFVVGE